MSDLLTEAELKSRTWAIPSIVLKHIDALGYELQGKDASIEILDKNVATLSTALDAALAERDKAYGEVDAVKIALADEKTVSAHYAESADILRARVAELEKALHEFGEHTDGCAVYEPGNKPCDCGYIKAKIGAAPADGGSPK